MTFFSGTGRWKSDGARFGLYGEWGNSLPKFGYSLPCSQTGVLACVVMQDKFIFPSHPALNSASARQRVFSFP
jgi:hypothetical protein